VIEETQKVTQRAQDMTGALWRDLAVTAAPFVLKILGDAGKLSAPSLAAAFYFAAAAYVALSFALQWRINKAYFRGQKISRRRWMQTLYTYISVQEREEIAEAPIAQAMASYREVRRALLIVYVVLIGALVWAGVQTLCAPPPAAVAVETAPKATAAAPAAPAVSGIEIAAPAAAGANAAVASTGNAAVVETK
jgi:hypothetical protein